MPIASSRNAEGPRKARGAMSEIGATIQNPDVPEQYSRGIPKSETTNV